MSDWQAVCDILRTEAPDQAERIEARLLHELGGETVYLPRRAKLTRDQAHKMVRETGGDVARAARQAGLSKATMYRRLRPAPRQDPGRLVR